MSADVSLPGPASPPNADTARGVNETTLPSYGLPPPRFQNARTITALMLREMGSTYGRSPGGYLWAILEPVAAVTLLSIGFSLIIRTPSLGTSFFLFYATGYLPFSLYGTLAGKMTSGLRASKSLLAYPRVTWMDALMARFALNLLTELTVFCIVVVGIVSFVETRAIIDLAPIIEGLVLITLLGVGVGLMNCLMIGLFPVWAQVWSVVSRPLFLASGIFFLYEDMPPLAQQILWWNPLMHAIGLIRTGFYDTYHASYVSLPYAFAVALVLIALFLVLLRRHHKKVLEN